MMNYFGNMMGGYGFGTIGIFGGLLMALWYLFLVSALLAGIIYFVRMIVRELKK